MKEFKKKWPLALSCLLLILLLIGLDQWTKWAVENSLDLYESAEMIPGFFALTYAQNTGGAFSMMDGMGMWFFIVVTIACIIGMVYLFAKTSDPGMEWSLALIIAGAVGNLIDRIRFGYVRDFFHFTFFGHSFAIFNVADICITVGFILMVLCIVAEEIKGKKQHGLSKNQ